jgi:hypothetical protein
LESQAGDALGVWEVGIEAVRPELHPARSQQLYLLALGQGSAPHSPERIGANHFGAVLIDALGALGEDPLVPVVAGTCIGKNLARNGRGPQHVEIVNFTEQILDFFEIIAPSLVLDGKKILYDITEAFDSYPQAVERDLGAVAQSTRVEFAGCGPALKSQMFKERAPGADAPGTSGERLAPGSPLFAIELFKSRLRSGPKSAETCSHSLNILVKYVRLYGSQHKRTEGQFEVTWNELQHGLPESGFLLGVSENRLLLDGVALESGQAERSFAQLLTAAGLASIHFSKGVTVDDFARLIKAFAVGGSKAQDVVQQIKDTFGDSKQSTIRINEVKFVAADPGSADVTVAAQIAAQTLGPEFKEWLNDPQKLLQLIAAAEGSRSGGAGGTVPIGSVPNVAGNAPSADGEATGGGGGTWAGGVVPLQEEEVMQAIRLLTKFGEVGADPGAKTESLQTELTQADPNTKLNLQQLLETLAAKNPAEKNDTPLLMKAAEHMAIRFAMERFQKGDIKVNAVHQMLEHMSRQMETLRQILRVHEDKMSKAGILVESHADILDRMFWAEVPEAGKKSVLLSGEAPCVPPRNIRQFIEVLLERGDTEGAAAILQNYSSCLTAKEAEPRRKAAIGLSQLADLFAAPGIDLIGPIVHKIGETLVRDPDPEVQSLLSAAFVRLSSEAGNRKQFAALSEVCSAIENVAKERPAMANELRPRIGVENRLPEFIEEALRLPQVPPDLIMVLRRTSQAAVEHLADRFFRCMRREECDRMVEIVRELGPDGLQLAREMLRMGPVRQASSVVGLLSRLDVPTLLELLPIRLKEWNRFYHDIVVRQIAYGAAQDRGRTLLEILEHLDAMVLPQAIDEIGMSGDRTTVPPLMVMAEAGESQGRSQSSRSRPSSRWAGCGNRSRLPYCAICSRPRRCGSGQIIASCESRPHRPWPRLIRATRPGNVR